MALGSVAAGEQRAWFLAVGLNDNTVRIISLDPSVRFSILFSKDVTPFLQSFISAKFHFEWGNSRVLSP